jgi:hypothetical protein
MLRITLAAIGLLFAQGAYAQARCDCDVIVGQCQATVEEVPTRSPGARFKLQANTEQCAIVEWSVDGDRGQTTIWDDGEEVSRVSPRKPGGTVKVHSCRVCKDTLVSRQKAPDGQSCKQHEFTDTIGAKPFQMTEGMMVSMVERSVARSEADLRAAMIDGINKRYQDRLASGLPKEGADIFREKDMEKLPGALALMRPLLNCVLDSLNN